jgi:hypothetical protein
MAFSWAWFTDNSFVSDYTICMMDLVFILVGIVMIILAYYGMKGTGL